MVEKKKFRDTALGQILTTKVPEALDLVGDVLPDKGVLGIVKNIISKKPDLTADEKAALMQQVDAAEREMFKLQLEDKASARGMQVEALKQNDVVSKRYIYYLSSFIIAAATAFGFMLFFVDVPGENRRMVEMFADVYLFAGALAVLNFFFGSSKSSHDKNEILKTQTENK